LFRTPVKAENVHRKCDILPSGSSPSGKVIVAGIALDVVGGLDVDEVEVDVPVGAVYKNYTRITFCNNCKNMSQ